MLPRDVAGSGTPARRGVLRHPLFFIALPLLMGAGVTEVGSPADGTPALHSPWVVPADILERPPLLDPIDTTWRTLLGLNYRTGEVSADLESRRGKVVKIPGFMVPFEDGITGVNEFLLVPYFGACIHTPPPPPNQMVYVRMDRGRTVEVNIWDAIWIEGRFEIQDIDSPYGAVGYMVVGDRIRPYGEE